LSVWPPVVGRRAPWAARLDRRWWSWPRKRRRDSASGRRGPARPLTGVAGCVATPWMVHEARAYRQEHRRGHHHPARNLRRPHLHTPRVGQPQPAQLGVEGPVALAKHQVAPRPLADEDPSAIAIPPRPTGLEGYEVVAHHRRVGLPSRGARGCDQPLALSSEGPDHICPAWPTVEVISQRHRRKSGKADSQCDRCRCFRHDHGFCKPRTKTETT
jgi:hypothetical protein